MNLKPEHFSNKDTTNFTNVEFVVTDGWLKITPLDALVITANDATKPYDGKPLTESGFDYVGMLTAVIPAAVALPVNLTRSAV